MPSSSGGLFERQAGEVAELDQLAPCAGRRPPAASGPRPGPAVRPPVARGDQLDVVQVDQFDARRPPPLDGRVLAAGVLDEDAAHGLGRGGEEVAAAVPVLRRVAADQPEVRLVDQGRGLERLPGLLLGQSSAAASLRSSS